MKLLKLLRRFGSMRTVVFAILLGVVSGASSTALVMVINETLFARQTHVWSHLVLAFIGLCVLLPTARIWSSLILVVLGSRAAFDLRLDLGRRILAAPLRRLEQVGPHRLMVALTDDVGSISAAFANVPAMVINASVVLGSLVYMAWLSWVVLLMVLVCMVFGVATYQLGLRIAIRSQELARHVEDELFDHFRGITQGTKELKARRRRRLAFLRHFETTAASFRDLQIRAMKIFLAVGNWGNMLFFVVIGLLLFGVLPLADVSARATGGYILILFYMLGPLQLVLTALPILTQADVSMRKVESLGLSLTDRLDDGPSEEAGTTAAPGWRRLDMVGVRHTYQGEDEDERFTLGPIDLVICPGQVTFVVGGNGSGKTTLAKLLIGLYLPEEGEIRLDGRPVAADSLEEYRQNFSVVFSDFYLFERLLGLESPALEEDARRYLVRLHLKHKVRVTDGRFSTTDLSHGQRKRLALLNAYLDDCPIFVFDEWAADQDPEFKEVFYHQILPELRARGKAVVVISHDDRYFDLADQIVKLEYGQQMDRRAAARAENPDAEPTAALSTAT